MTPPPPPPHPPTLTLPPVHLMVSRLLSIAVFYVIASLFFFSFNFFKICHVVDLLRVSAFEVVRPPLSPLLHLALSPQITDLRSPVPTA